jgi:hypothetical protein
MISGDLFSREEQFHLFCLIKEFENDGWFLNIAINDYQDVNPVIQ